MSIDLFIQYLQVSFVCYFGTIFYFVSLFKYIIYYLFVIINANEFENEQPENEHKKLFK